MELDTLRSEHITEILALEKECYGDDALTKRKFDNIWDKNVNSNGYVYLNGKREVIGYILFAKSVQRHNLQIMRIAVKKTARRHGIGTKLMQQVKSLSHAHLPTIYISVSETNLVGQLFLRSQGFVAKSINKEDENNVYYDFIFRYQWKADHIFEEDEVLDV